jgi:hypothetical protein
MTLAAELVFDFLLFSAPAIWSPTPGAPWAVAVITGQVDEGGRKRTAVDAYDPGGARLKGFPALRRDPYLVAPGSQVGAGDWNGDGAPDLLVVDLDGNVASFRATDTGPETLRLEPPVQGLLTCPPRLVRVSGEQRDDLLLVSQHYAMIEGTRDAVGLWDRTGRPRPGYPIFLEGTPALHPAVLDLHRGHLFLLMPSGQVHGFDMRAARPLPGFPTPPPQEPAGEAVHLAFFPPLGGLLLGTGADHLRHIDVRTGQSVPVASTAGGRLTGVASTGEAAYVVDEANGRLLRLDERAAISGEIALGWPGRSRSQRVQTATLQGPPGSLRTGIVVISCPQVDWAARIHALFVRHASPEVQQEIAALADDEARLVHGSVDLDPEQRREIDHSATMMKKGHLQKVLGESALSEQLGGAPETRIQVIQDDGRHLSPLIDDLVVNHDPTTDSYLSHTMDAALQTGPLGIAQALIVPLNEARPLDPDKGRRSRIRIYSLSS